VEQDDFDIVADFIVQKDPALGRELVYVVDQWDSLRRWYEKKTEQGETVEEIESARGWDEEMAERMERIRPLRDALEQRAFGMI
jgi:hypothetical protein